MKASPADVANFVCVNKPYPPPFHFPTRFQALLASAPELRAAVDLTFAEFIPWIDSSGTPLFPDYTDHGVKHLEGVAFSAEGLISERSYDFVTAADAAYLLSAVLLHDSGMHLSEDGFLDLVGPKTDRPIIEGYDEHSWAFLWKEYLTEARHWDSKRLRLMFGDTKPVRTPPADPSDWTKRDRQFIGEFVRRHHPRLAHETALWGVPGPTPDKLRFRELDDETLNIIGAIARSHGSELRWAVDRIDKKQRAEDWLGAHPAFLMGVLRIADYIQLDAPRAPTQLLRIKKIRSPISVGEFALHHSIKAVKHDLDDPEALWIEVLPKDPTTFVRFSRLVRGLQAELDSTWASFGEAYGAYPTLQQLGLVIRRVRSTIDDRQYLSKKVSYIPREASFESDPRIVQLLVAPLYGDRPEVGVRELLQNAVDAVRRRWAIEGVPQGEDYSELKSESQSVPLAPEFSGAGWVGSPKLPLGVVDPNDADVLIELQTHADGSKWLIITDNGVGMTADTVIRFFLRASAQFRDSEEWQKYCSTEEKRRIALRAGRFGIGILAAFTLGSELKVTTRHLNASSDQSLQFEARLDDELIEIWRVTDKESPIGTKIEIRLDATASEKLFRGCDGFSDESIAVSNGHTQEWDWFCLRNPRVVRMVSPPGVQFIQGHRLPDMGAELPKEWRRIYPPGYAEVHWHFSLGPILACNGIVVVEDRNPWGPPSLEVQRLRWSDRNLPFHTPHVSVFDPDGNLPLNLQRNGLTTDFLPFERELLADVMQDFFLFVLTCLPDDRRSAQREGWCSNPPYMGFCASRVSGSPLWPKFFLHNQGLAWLNPSSVEDNGTKALVVIPTVGQGDSFSPSNLADDVGVTTVELLPRGFGQRPNAEVVARHAADWVQYALGGAVGQNYSTSQNNLEHLPVVGRRVYIHRLWFDRIARLIGIQLPQSVPEGRWIVLHTGNQFKPVISMDDLPFGQGEQWLNCWPGLVAEWKLGDVSAPANTSSFVPAWNQAIGLPCIPFDAAKRDAILGPMRADFRQRIEFHIEDRRRRGRRLYWSEDEDQFRWV